LPGRAPRTPLDPTGIYRREYDHGAFNARRIHGQTIYVDPKAEMMIVRFASNPQASNVNFDDISLPAYQAVAERLMQKK
jgi:CubicO group peptidase (beta-lactamase class C family)